MKTVTLTNLVSNALFASGTGWTSYTGVSGGEMWDAGASWNGFGSTVAIADVSGRKYYYAVSAKASDANRDTRYGLGLGSGGASVFSATDIKVSSYTRKSSIRTSAATQNIYVGFYIPDATTTTVYCNGVLYIDLTSAFGAGNEPDLAWCDMFIPFFNGTTTVNLYTENSLIIEGGGHRNSRFVTGDGGYAIVGQNGSGGIVTYDGNYVIHTFNSSGTFICPGTGTAQVLVVAGGGGGYRNLSGGGGGGGVIYSNSFGVSPQTYSVVVGNGGGADSYNGENSSFSSLVAIGGGRGGSRDNFSWGATVGGSGGGGAGKCGTNNPAGAAGTSGQGNAGGTGYGPSSDAGADSAGGGGGGAGGAGGNGAYRVGGNGGVGIPCEISGTLSYYGGGGGGGTYYTQGQGGLGGGGIGATSAGTANTGGGGGSGYGGGSGVVIIRYLVNSLQL